jgi:hypothetical protein
VSLKPVEHLKPVEQWEVFSSNPSSTKKENCTEARAQTAWEDADEVS